MSIVNLQEDFDWFAVDANGAVALFATAGQGFVPPTVVEFHVMHETVAGSIVYPNWGTDQIWNDAANLGLYVFDWSLPDGPYQRVASPEGVSDDTLPSMIKRITHLPVLKTSFADHTQITQLDQFAPPP
ncbi:MAG: hypothetical protein ACR2PZ_19725 [Pseudomonadales bacterium]